MREQIVRLAENYCVTAGAGAGKTRCLVEAYLNLLIGGEGREPLKPEQIVAITFTEKAAAEMRSRIQGAIASQARAGQTGPDWSGLLLAVEWAPISTIHGFCAGLLREFAPLAGLDPDFAVLEEEDHGLLMLEVADELVRVGLKAQAPALLRVLGRLSLGGGNGLAATLLGIHAALATQGVSPEQARAATARAHEEALAQGDALLGELASVMESLAQAKAAGKINQNTKYSAKAMEAMEIWPRLLPDLQASPPRTEAVETLLGLFRGNWGKVNDLRQRADKALASMQELAAVPLAAALADDLLDLATRLHQAAEQEKARRAVLCFDDLLNRALALAQGHGPVLTELRRRYRALLVDEFQDVNPVQSQIIYLLAGLEGELVAEPPPRVMLVGDRKQSIYAFRGAEVGVFSGAMERFGQGAGQAGGQARGKVAALPDNFRSRPELVTFFNRIFQHIFGAGEATLPPEAQPQAFGPHDEQTPGRTPDESHSPSPAVVVLDCRQPEGQGQPSAAGLREAEAQALAGFLAGLVAQGTPPGSIAILLRRLTQVGLYEQALRQAGVDFYTVRGRGFYECQEVADLALALKALLDPGDHLALAGMLRSPLVGLSDEALLALCHPEGQGFLPLGLAVAGGAALPAWLGPEQAQRLERARGLLARLRPLARRLAPAELLECLVESSDLLPLWLATPSGRQRAANLRKLIEAARQPGPRLAGGVEGFAAGLADLVERPPQDPQAPLLGEDAQVVRIMSIHQAKGLEFPLVVLPDLASKPPPNRGVPVGAGGVVGAAPWDPGRGYTLKSPVHRAIREAWRAVEEQEAARLFYVACTRAQERLIFCLGDKHRGSHPWRAWVENLVLADEAVEVVQAPAQAASVASIPALVEAWPGWLPPGPGPLAKDGAALAERALHPPILPLARVSESVSGLENWLACPRLWFLTRRLGLDTANLPGPGGGNGRAGMAAEMGSLVHQTLERADLQAGPAGLEAALGHVLGGRELNYQEREEVLRRAKGVWDTELPALLAQADGLWREEPFHLFLGADGQGLEVEIKGEFDLLARMDDGWLVADYKVTDHMEPEDYRAQLALYALALWQGQEGGGQPPRMLLCYLTNQGGRLVDMAFSPAELEAWRARVLDGARAMAAVGTQAGLADLPMGPGCWAGVCALAGRGLCPEGEA